jgi:class 3 adenylate cyclase
MPGTVAFTGHMMDRPNRVVPRFPPEAEARVMWRIARELEQLQAAHGYASAACGGDLLFLEAMLRRGGEIHVVLPCPAPEFREACVDIIPNSDWGARFEKVMARAASREILSEQCAADNAMASECCNRVVLGLATMNARAAGEVPSVLALWDGRPGDAIGGTHSMMEFCWAHDRPVRVIDELAPAQAASLGVRPIPPAPGSSPQRFGAMVFADVVKFSALRERQLPSFARNYLGSIMKICERMEVFPLSKNTWGDGLYMVFETVRDAGVFALELCDLVNSTQWAEFDLPADFNVRIGVHAGPVYQIHDPIIGQWSYIGSHVTRAARIEPQSPPGVVYASRAYAALVAAEGLREIDCDYVGEIELAKGYGAFPTYRLITGRT